MADARPVTGTPAIGAATWSPAWAVAVEGDSLILSAGADLSYQIDGLAEGTIAEVLGWAAGDPVGPTTAQADGVASQLLQAGPLRPAAPAEPVEVVGGGPVAKAVEQQLRFREHHLTSPGAPPREAPSLLSVVVAESAAGWPSIPDHPHLLVDATGHHTVVIGPYVVPGFSACHHCLQTRSARRWPQPLLPAEPAVTSYEAVVAQLALIQVGQIAAGRGLINATIAWDLTNGAVSRDGLLRVPGCPQCRSQRR